MKFNKLWFKRNRTTSQRFPKELKLTSSPCLFAVFLCQLLKMTPAWKCLWVSYFFRLKKWFTNLARNFLVVSLWVGFFEILKMLLAKKPMLLLLYWDWMTRWLDVCLAAGLWSTRVVCCSFVAFLVKYHIERFIVLLQKLEFFHLYFFYGWLLLVVDTPATWYNNNNKNFNKTAGNSPCVWWGFDNFLLWCCCSLKEFLRRATLTTTTTRVAT